LAFGADLGAVGLWWGLCAGLTAVAVALVIRFLRSAARGVEPIVANE
jgi:multidrug resistance protein, MATE family